MHTRARIRIRYKKWHNDLGACPCGGGTKWSGFFLTRKKRSTGWQTFIFYNMIMVGLSSKRQVSLRA